MKSESAQPGDFQPDATSHDAFMRKFQGVIESYAKAVNADDQEQADKAAMLALMMASMDAMENPTPYLQLSEKASEQLAAGNWQGAEDTYRELIALEEHGGKPGQTTKPLMDLSRLFYLLGRLEEAWFFSRKATESARASDISTLLAMALDCETTSALASGKTTEALAAAEEGLRVIDPGKMGDLMRAMAYANRGRACLGLGDVSRAEKDREAAWANLRAKKQSRIGTGPAVAFARCFELEAELHARQKRFPEAISVLKQAIEYRRQCVDRSIERSPHPTAAVARDLERLAEIHRQNGDKVAAGEALEEAAELWRQLHLHRL